MKKIIKFIKNIINILFDRKIKIIGKFQNWKVALQNSSSYNNKVIFQKTKKSFEQVLKKNAKFERDSIAFYENSPDKELISIIKKIYKNKKIIICDFGGSLASLYFQNKDYLDPDKYQWHVIEQKQYVKYAKNNMNNKNLKFHTKFNSLPKKKIDLVIFSSVLQYIEFPDLILKKVFEKKTKNIIITRTPFHKKEDVIKIQVVTKHIYAASYPIRIFNKKNFLNKIKIHGYKIKKKLSVEEAIDGYVYQGFYFKKN